MPEAMQRLQDRRQLANGMADERSDAAQRMFQSVAQAEGDSPAGRIVSDALRDKAKTDPKVAAQILDLLDQYKKQGQLVQNAATKPGLSGLLSVLAEGLILSGAQNQQGAGAAAGDGLDPTSQFPNWTSGASIGDTAKQIIAREIVNLLLPVGTSLPIFQPDTSPLISPVEDILGWKPGSGGYGSDGKAELPISTGGSRIDEQGGWSTLTPAENMPGLGNVYNDEKPVLVTNPKHVPGGTGLGLMLEFSHQIMQMPIRVQLKLVGHGGA